MMNLIEDSQLFKIIDKCDFAILNKYGYSNAFLQSNKKYGKFLKIYLLLTHLYEFDEFLADLSSYSNEDIFINRYYWLKKFIKSYSEINGFDAGMDQQVANLLDEISCNIPNFKWEILLEVDYLLGK